MQVPTHEGSQMAELAFGLHARHTERSLHRTMPATLPEVLSSKKAPDPLVAASHKLSISTGWASPADDAGSRMVAARKDDDVEGASPAVTPAAWGGTPAARV